MNTRERFQAVMDFQPFDRLPIIEWATWWDKTIERWESEGLPVNLEGADIMRYFDLDVHFQDWFNPRGPGLPAPESHNAGRITDMDDYERLKEHFYPWPIVDHSKWQKWAEEQKSDVILWITLEGFFWFPRTLFGIEEHLFAFYDQPELMHRMNHNLAEYHLKIIDEVCSICVPDFMTFAEDMSYNNGPMLSKELFDEFMRPYYDKVVPRLKEYGIRIMVDSDGDITEPTTWFEEAGIEGILPLERQAGVDIARLREEHPRQLYIGAFDKMTMSKGEEAMRAEFERLLLIAKKGGFIISCDHQTPPEVSLENYKIYLKLFRKYAVRAARG